MTLKEVRTELLQQHADLRRTIGEAAAMMDRWASGEDARHALRRILVHLSEALAVHNAREVALLRGVISKIDAWGEAREEIMNERHVHEHQDIFDALLVATESPNAKAAAPLLATVFDRLLEHMGREENAFLKREVLHDDDEPLEVDSFGG
jgi:Hemerythrin HHE cation binding domain